MHLLRGRWQRACTRCQMFIFPFRTSVAPSREASHLILASLDNSPWVSSAQAQPTRSLSAGTSPGSNHCSVPYLDSHHLKKEGMAGGGRSAKAASALHKVFHILFPLPKEYKSVSVLHSQIPTPCRLAMEQSYLQRWWADDSHELRMGCWCLLAQCDVFLS